ncbi:F4 family fimbrial subunit [Citrobacter freundii]|uniref:F4 family fimbrial subunit n=1 Tax=Citrobacter freundii TaxID=546 RepID=UPI00383A5B3B
MKKTLIALAVAASAAVSGSVMAAEWVEAQPGNIDIGGEINTQSVKWLWKTGDGLSSFSSLVTDISNRVLNIPVTTDQLFLAGKMDKGFKGTFSGNSLIPKVEMASYDGSVISPEFIDNSSMNISVKVKDGSNNTELGALSIPLTFGAAVATIFEGEDQSSNNIASITSGSPGTVFEGLTRPGGMTSKEKSYKWTGVSADEMANYVKVLMPGYDIREGDVYHNWNNPGQGNYAATNKASYLTYGAGIEANSSLTMNLNKDISGHVEWKAPVAITITYS